MKRIVSLILCGVLAVSLFALSGCKEKKKEEKKAAVQGESHRIDLRVDQSQGKMWFYTASAEGMVSITEEFVPDSEGSMQGKSIFTVTALKEGAVTVTFGLAQTVEAAHELEAVYDFTIDKDLKYTMIIPGGSYYEQQ